MKKLMAIITMLTLLFTMTACSGSDSSESEKDDGLTITYENNTLTVEGKGELTADAICEQLDIKVSDIATGRTTTLIIGDGVTAIEKDLFRNCKILNSVTLGKDVEEIGEYAFYGCSITEITIPDSVKSIGKSAFGACESLEKVTLGIGIEKIADYTFTQCFSLKEVTVPENVTAIGEGAFFRCSSLEKVTLSDGLETIGEEAFVLCGSLSEIEIPQSVKTVAEDAFGKDTKVIRK